MFNFRLIPQCIVKNTSFGFSKQWCGTRSLTVGTKLSRYSPRRRPTSSPDYSDEQETSRVIDLESHLPKLHRDGHGSKPAETSEDVSPAAPSAKKTVTPKSQPLPFSFVKLQENDHRLREAMNAAKSKKGRERSNLILLEGKRLILDALSAGARPDCFFFSRSKDILDIPVPTGDDAVPIYKVQYKELQLWSDVITSPGVFGIFKVPNPNISSPPEESMPLTIICDNIRDPGNLGSILRVAAGVGSSEVILTKGCCDMWDTKVLRSAAGAHFRIPILNKVDWQKMPQHIKESSHVFLADNNRNFDLKPRMPFKDSADQPSIFIHDVAFNEDRSDGSDEEKDEEDEEDEDCVSNERVENREMKALQDAFSAYTPYFEIDYVKRSPMVLILGGETHGVSLEALRFARYQESCSRLNIPMFNDVDSLNSGVALAVITFEMQRQFILSNRSTDNNESFSEELLQKN